MKALLDFFLDLLFPPRCIFCGKLLRDEEEVCCEKCHKELPYYKVAERKLSFIEDVASVFYYRDNVRESIHRFKFGGRAFYAEHYSRWMAEAVREKIKEPFEIISWVPCSPWRKWNRGYDQAQKLAEALSKELGVPCVKTLRKVRNNRRQSGLKGEAARRANVMGAYRTVRKPEVGMERVLLVDDVLTTGATIEECAKTLLLGGFFGISCVFVAASRNKDE